VEDATGADVGFARLEVGEVGSDLEGGKGKRSTSTTEMKNRKGRRRTWSFAAGQLAPVPDRPFWITEPP
jgi:hypothetical protein